MIIHFLSYPLQQTKRYFDDHKNRLTLSHAIVLTVGYVKVSVLLPPAPKDLPEL
jgi:hypothetical protein